MVDHASKKGKRESWRRGIVCDRERKLSMKNHISLSVNLN
jgi:hypothetical protein